MIGRTFRVLSIAVCLAAALIVSLPGSDAGVDNDQGEVSYYTYTYNFAFEGTDAQTILWDFGFSDENGDPVRSTEWNPRNIVFPAKGTYTITQKVSNTVGSYTSQMKLTVLGTPEVTFQSNGGTDVAGRTVSVGTLCTEPQTPEREGCTFEGWYADQALTDRWDFSVDAVNGHMTLYAKWTEKGQGGGNDEDGKDGEGNGDKKDDGNASYVWIAQLLIVVIGSAIAVAAHYGKIDKKYSNIGIVVIAVGMAWFLLPAFLHTGAMR